MVRAGLFVLGGLLTLAGTLWALQGAGLVMWPASSFMLQEQRWVTYGTATAIAGLAVIGLALRLRR
jgi:hypothetical protein